MWIVQHKGKEGVHVGVDTSFDDNFYVRCHRDLTGVFYEKEFDTLHEAMDEFKTIVVFLYEYPWMWARIAHDRDGINLLQEGAGKRESADKPRTV